MKNSLKYILPTTIVSILISFALFYLIFNGRYELIKLTDDTRTDCLIKINKLTQEICQISTRSCKHGYFYKEDLPKVCESE